MKYNDIKRLLTREENEIVCNSVNKLSDIIITDDIISKDNIAKLCEVAYITGKLESEGKIQPQDKDLYEMYDDIYYPIYIEFKYGVTSENDGSKQSIFKNEEEKGYISAYSQRRLIDLFGSINEE